VRDPFTGRVYVEVVGPAILVLGPDGGAGEPFAIPPAPGRLALGPDALYHLTVGHIQAPAVTRFELPEGR
jgi:hypothetical protein